MYSRNFGSDKIVLTYIRPPLQVSTPSSTPRVSVVNHTATGTLRERQIEKNNNNNKKAESFVRLNFNVYINVENRERAKARNTQQRRPISLEEKHQNFTAAVKKWEMLAATKVKMCGNQKKWAGTHNISCIKRVVVENNGKEMYKKVLDVQSCCFFFTVIVVFTDSYTILYFVWVNYKYFKKRASLSAMANIFCEKEYVKFPSHYFLISKTNFISKFYNLI